MGWPSEVALVILSELAVLPPDSKRMLNRDAKEKEKTARPVKNVGDDDDRNTRAALCPDNLEAVSHYRTKSATCLAVISSHNRP